MKRANAKMIALVAAVLLAASSAVYATTSVYINEDDLAYRGSWSWNSATGSVVKVRVANIDSDPESDSIRVYVQARALDGTTVRGQAFGQIRGGSGKEFTISLSKPISSLVLIQIVEIPTN